MRTNKLVRTLLIVTVLTPTACTDVGLSADDAPDDEGAWNEDEGAIVNGTLHFGDPSVVAVRSSSGSLCTGTVISPHVVLTAAHCVHPESVGSATFSIIAAPNLGAATVRNRAQASKVLYSRQWQPKNLEAGHDLAFLVFDTALSLTPVPINRTPLTAQSNNRPVRLVGYGKTGTKLGDSGVKRATTSSVRAITNMLEIYNIQHGICSGDSGGPMFMTIGGREVLAGVNSYVVAPSSYGACGISAASTRTDNELALIDQIVGTYDPGFTPGATPTPSPTPVPSPTPQPGTTRTESVAGDVTSAAPDAYQIANVKGGTVFTVRMTGTGAIDLYVRVGARPTSTQFNCRPHLRGANETCQITVPAGAAQAVFIGAAGDGSYSISATWTSAE